MKIQDIAKLHYASISQVIGFLADFGIKATNGSRTELTKMQLSLFKDPYEFRNWIAQSRTGRSLPNPRRDKLPSTLFARAEDAVEAMNAKIKPRTILTEKAVAHLNQWAYFPNMNSQMRLLASRVEAEAWHRGNDEFHVLKNYLNYTYQRLVREGNKLIIRGKYAIFNTGLVDESKEYVYALFSRNDPGHHHKWKFLDFGHPGLGIYRENIKNSFSDLPAPANYLDRPENLIYDCSAARVNIKEKHIGYDNVDRLPRHLLTDLVGECFTCKASLEIGEDERKNYQQALLRELSYRKDAFLKLVGELAESISNALKRAERDYRVAVPIYYPGRNRISLALPIQLPNSERKADLALIVSRDGKEKYTARTIYSLDMVYGGARFLGRPTADWLKPEDCLSLVA